MKLLFITLAAMLLLCPLKGQAQDASGPEAIPFHISSYKTGFAMQGDFEGEYRVYPNSIEVSLSKVVIRVGEHCPYKGRREFVALQFMLATTRPDGRWKLDLKSQPYLVRRIMIPGDEYSLGSLHFSIPKEETTDLSQRWFVVQMDDLALDLSKDEDPLGFAFAHSSRDIFTQKHDPQ
ncbi:MAG TPA: hypothetical protein VGC89_00745 [Pyrinomonadaceae bacterium]|jgi:hypothetical protein